MRRDHLTKSGQEHMVEFEALCRMNGGQRNELRPCRPFALTSQLTVVDAAAFKRLPSVIEPAASFGLEDCDSFIGFEG